MPNVGFYAAWDQGLVDLINKFAAFSPMMQAQMAIAMARIGTHLVTVARGNMHWMKPTGKLSASMHVANTSSTQVVVGTDLPYGWRREKGYSGMTDRIGRYYRFDPGQYYMTKALISTIPYGIRQIESAAFRALGV